MSTNLPPSDTSLRDLPPRFRETAFRRFEPYIAQAVKAYPRVVTIDPSREGLRAVTFACRMRDAMNSYEKHRWPTTAFNHIAFVEARVAMVVAERGQNVVVGDRDWIDSDAVRVIPATSTQVAGEHDLMLPPNTVTLLGYLADQRLLTVPLRIRGFTANDAEWLEANFDVAVTPNNDGTFTLI